MRTNKRKVAIVGTGMVGISCAYYLLNQSACDELVLIDVNKKRAEGEVMDSNHGLVFVDSSVTIYAEEYDDCSDADIVVMCTGVVQKQDETRLDLSKRDAEVLRSIIESITSSGFNELFLVVADLVDIMIRITCTLSGFNPRWIPGTGTTLDTVRLRYLLDDYLKVDPRNAHAYVMGEHGDGGFMLWSQALLVTKPILELCGENGEAVCRRRLDETEREVRMAAYRIIKAKSATYYGTGVALTRITKAILRNGHGVLTVSVMLWGEYGQMGVPAGVPCIINQDGIQRVFPLFLTPEGLEKLGRSYDMLREGYDGVF